ncbi:MAG: sodium:alanine symporter family protein [Lachnospiraceae bacterium]|nr:sodium:alanine symporter family protein [Lachnospiraceae bacterium]
MSLEDWIQKIDNLVWGPWLLVLLLGTGIYLTVRLRFLSVRNLKYAMKCVLGSDKDETRNEYELSATENYKKNKSGKVSSFSSLTTELAATIGTGNIVGVSTAMVLGGPGALFWMVVSGIFGMATKLVESTLAVKYRGKNEKGQTAGGPMYVMEKAFPNRKIGHFLAVSFAVFAVFASFGMGNMTQANSIADALDVTFRVSKANSGLIFTVLTILVVLGGIGFIGKFTQLLVPLMGIIYMAGTITVILFHWKNIPMAMGGIMTAAFSPKAVSGGLFGHLTTSAMDALRWGISRGIFSNEAGLGAAGISAAAADTDDYIKQGYISMTGVFLDTIVICTATGLALASSGVLGALDESGKPLTGTALTLKAFHTVLGDFGECFIAICIVLFAFATIIAWAYQGERAFEFLMRGKVKYNLFYRLLYGFVAFVGCVCPLQMVWNLSDICNGLMAIPNLICVLVLSEEICKEITAREYR